MSLQDTPPCSISLLCFTCKKNARSNLSCFMIQIHNIVVLFNVEYCSQNNLKMFDFSASEGHQEESAMSFARGTLICLLLAHWATGKLNSQYIII